ncbi:unnamed protein product [Bursaphelenchus xylophilus]|uniref:(pine wood nematode) hypothetical protein n=1 Tax=Bursaphelenchus xylophilus TaxID=6326 RepID=A0A1I7RID1_BURXY|nr:unnamed protein product [Bursaphelenchus xylophilus]CAG9080921.1 unnamed protein product [Bursaphelenchus xylophilus]
MHVLPVPLPRPLKFDDIKANDLLRKTVHISIMKAVCLVFIAFAFATVVSAEYFLYTTCKNLVLLENLGKKAGSCGEKMDESQKERCDGIEEMAKSPPSEANLYFALLSGVLQCKYLRCELTEEYCESNKAMFDRVWPHE